jgi:8-oxo-dGTP diphosphatase
MIKVELHPFKEIPDGRLAFAVVMARTASGWLFVRHRDRQTWEIPGGHRERGETVGQTAARELYEETGAEASVMTPVTAYSVSNGPETSCGVLFFAEAGVRGALPQSEIAEVRCADAMPEALTYPDIQPLLFAAGSEFAQSWDYTMSDVF